MTKQELEFRAFHNQKGSNQTCLSNMSVDPNRLSYVLITPAKNELLFIKKTIESVISQSHLPTKWIVVSDGSTDGTDDIVNLYISRYGWIEIIRLPERKERHFAGKAGAFNAGYSKLRNLNFDIIGNLDADISFDKEYFAFLLSKFAENPKLGVAGTPFMEGGQKYNYRFTSIEHVSGACQLFRRECYESIGGYSPLKEGGIDLLAVITARMKGWETRTFLEKTCVHHRKMGTGLRMGLNICFRGGHHDYLMGVNLLWQFYRSLYQMTRRPYLVFGSAILAGYLWGMATMADRIVSKEVIEFRKKEQLSRLRKYFHQVLLLKKGKAGSTDPS